MGTALLRMADPALLRLKWNDEASDVSIELLVDNRIEFRLRDVQVSLSPEPVDHPVLQVQIKGVTIKEGKLWDAPSTACARQIEINAEGKCIEVVLSKQQFKGFKGPKNEDLWKTWDSLWFDESPSQAKIAGFVSLQPKAYESMEKSTLAACPNTVTTMQQGTQSLERVECDAKLRKDLALVTFHRNVLLALIMPLA